MVLDTAGSSLVAAGGEVDMLELERLDMLLRLHALALVFPGGGVAEVLVVAQGLAFGRLVLLAEVAAAALAALQRVQAHELAQLDEVGHAAGHFEALVQLFAGARHAEVAPEFL